jgi:hypothetical protein
MSSLLHESTTDMLIKELSLTATYVLQRTNIIRLLVKRDDGVFKNIHISAAPMTFAAFSKR